MIDYFTCAEMAKRFRAERARQVVMLRSYGLTLEQVSLVLGISLMQVQRVEKAQQKVGNGGTEGNE
jgi:hypothetical protein